MFLSKLFIKNVLFTEGISKDDINRVTRRLLKSPPCMAARGEVKAVPSLSDVQSGLIDAQGRLPGSRSRLSLFR